MNQLNQIILEGNVVRQPEVKINSNGTKYATFPIGVNRYYKVGDKVENEVSYFDIDTYGNLAEVCSQWCPKGRGIRVVGRLRQNRWNDSDGKPNSWIKVVAEHIEFKPVFKKEGDAGEKSGPTDATSSSVGDSKKQKLAMLAEAAAAAEKEQEAGEEIVF